MRSLAKRPFPATKQPVQRHLSSIASTKTARHYDYDGSYDNSDFSHFDSSYVKRYRDPTKHESKVVRRHGRLASPSSNAGAPSTSSAAYSTAASTSSSSSVYVNTPPLLHTRKSHEKRGSYRSSQLSKHNNPKNTPRPSQKTALLFPGSGSQYVGMSQFLLDNFKTAREVWEEAEDALAHFEDWRKGLQLHELPELKHLDLLNWPVWQKERSADELGKIVANGPQDELTRSSNAQPAITITSRVLERVLTKDFGVPIASAASFFAGHSSGEYSACVASGAITFAEGVKLTRLHGLLTSRTLQLSSLKTYSDHSANDEERAQMSALVLHHKKGIEDVLKVVKETREKNKGNAGMVEVASYNSSMQLVLSGSRAGVLRACERLQDKDIASRAADLPVFAPFHCSFMAPAAHGMAYAWDHGVSAKAPSAPIVSNLTASLITSPERLKFDIVASVHKPVLWASALDVMKEQGVTRFVYIGPGRALANLANKELKNGRWKDSKEDIEIIPVATIKDFEECAEECENLIIKKDGKKAQLEAAAV